MTYRRNCQLAQDILIRARDILTIHGWIQKNYAKDENGHVCSPTWSGASCFCSIGAMRRAALEVTGRRGHPAFSIAQQALQDQIEKHSFFCGIVAWNDYGYTTIDRVTTMFSHAIKAMKA